ncbi:MAG: amino acid ABC transporter permease [Pseudomonadota bacterium]
MAVSAEGAYRWGWYVVLPTTEAGSTNLAFLVGGLWITIQVSVLATLLATVLGLLVALPGLSEDRWARAFNRGFVEVFRAVPTLVMLLWVHYGLPVVLGVSLDVFTSGVLALAICESAFMAEVFRAGIQSIGRGQHEAAQALGLTPWQRFRLVILPQAVRRILPALGNQFVIVLKMSALVSVIGLADLTRRANELVTTLYRPLEIYTFLVLEYLVLVLVVSWAVRRLERHLAAGEGRG